MKRRLNYTGRKRILRAGIRLRTDEAGATPAVIIEQLDVTGLELVGEAVIVLEAQRQMTYERIEVGSATGLVLPLRRELTRFIDLEGVNFRVKIVGADDGAVGRILAAADGLAPVADPSDTTARSLLHFKSADLGQRVWKLILTDDVDWPVVHVNKNAGELRDFANSEAFVAYAYPEILAQIAVETLVDDAWDEAGTWQYEWGRFFAWLGMSPSEAPLPNGNPDDLAEWIDDLVDTFCRRHSLADLAFKEEGDE